MGRPFGDNEMTNFLKRRGDYFVIKELKKQAELGLELDIEETVFLYIHERKDRY